MNRKTRVKIAIVSGVALLLLSGGLIFNQTSSKSNSVSSQKAPQTRADLEASSPASSSTASVLPESSPPPEPTNAQTTADATMCEDTIATARLMSENNTQMFSDGLQSWKATFAGVYDSPQARKSKDWNKNYIKELYDEFISQNNEMYLKFCDKGGSINDVVLQPNYDLWQ